MNRIRAYVQRISSSEYRYYDYLIKPIVRSRYFKHNINQIMMSVCTIIVRIHLDLLVQLGLRTGWTAIDLISGTIISVLIVLNSNLIHEVVKKFESDIYLLTRHYINNYSDNNYRIWKRNITIGICLYIFIYTWIVEINNQIIQLWIGQYLLCYMVIDSIESGRLCRFISLLTGSGNNGEAIDPVYQTGIDDDDISLSDSAVQSIRPDDDLSVRKITMTDLWG